MDNSVSTIVDFLKTARRFELHEQYPDINHPAYLDALGIIYLEDSKLHDALVSDLVSLDNAFQKTYIPTVGDDCSNEKTYSERRVSAGFNATNHTVILTPLPFSSPYPSYVMIGACIKEYVSTKCLNSEISEYVLLQLNRDISRNRTLLRDLLPEDLHQKLDADIKHLMINGKLQTLNSHKFEQLLKTIDLKALTVTQTAHLIQNGLFCSSALYDTSETSSLVFEQKVLDEWFNDVPHWEKIKSNFISLESLGFINAYNFGQFDLIHEQVMSVNTPIAAVSLSGVLFE